VNKKQKLILHFVLDCFFIILMCLTWAARFLAPYIYGCLGIYFLSFAVYSRLFFPAKPHTKKRERELTTAEVIAVFAIAISGFYILVFTKVASLLHSIAFIIPMGIIFIAIRLIYFSKELAALQTSRSASN
jgi:hypothetical protein